MPGVSGSSRMFTAAELIEALRRRTVRSLRPESPVGEFPPGWRAWFASLREQAGRIRGATADAIIAIFLAREPRPRSEEHTSELQSRENIVCRLLLEKKK